MKKILLIDDNFHSINKGAPLFSMERKFLLEEGYEVYTISFDASSDEVEIDKDFIINTNLSGLGQKISKFHGSKNIEDQIKDIIQKIQPDVIHNHLISKYPISVFNALPENIPVIQTLHGPNFFCPTSWGNMKKDSSPCDLGVSLKCVAGGCIPIWQYPIMYNLFSKMPKLLEKVTLFHCPSKNIEKVSQHFGFTNTKIISLGLRENFTNISPKTNFKGNKILFIGSLHAVKGLDYLLESMIKIIKINPQVKLLIAGRGPSEKFYRHMVTNLKLEKNIEFLGFVMSVDIIDLYQSVDITIVPSIWSEQFGMVGPESLACGVPVIGSNVGGIPEWLKDNEHGILVPPRNSEQLAEKILFLLENKEMLIDYGKKGHAYMNQVHTNEQYKINLLEMIKDVQR
ncbi:MAG TPA: glycosyltransferase family 1 protein, partial [Arcobacter sp.]|nr:glycosyltransferase family 1 protein [Arcobacter sp.]